LWLFKTALVLHLASQQERFIPGDHYVTLWRKRTIPRGVVITLADYDGDDELYWIQRQGWTALPAVFSVEELAVYFKRTYRMTLRAGRLVWRIHYWPEDGKPRFGAFEYLGSMVRYIHPVGAMGISWPPSDTIGEMQVLDESLMISAGQAFQ
jgi:hypothetical protein